MQSADKRHVIRAQMIREILLGRHVEQPDPHGLRLVGARITGTLDLDWLRSAIGLELSRCAMDEPVTMQGARLPWMTLDGTHLPSLYADGLQTVGTVNIRGLRAETDSESGAVRLIGAHIGGSLNCDGAVLINKSGPALHADGLEIEGAVLLNGGFHAEANSANGAVRLVGAHIGVSIECLGGVLTNGSGPALLVAQSQVNGSVFLTQGYRAAGRGRQAAVRIVSTKINGSLNFHNGQALNPDGPALELHSSSVGQLCLPGKCGKPVGYGE